MEGGILESLIYQQTPVAVSRIWLDNYQQEISYDFDFTLEQTIEEHFSRLLSYLVQLKLGCLSALIQKKGDET